MKAAKVFRKVGQTLTRIGKRRADDGDEEGSWSDSQDDDEFSYEDESMLTYEFTDEQSEDYDQEDDSDVFSGTISSEETDDYFDDDDDEDRFMSNSMASESLMTPASEYTSEAQTIEDSTTVSNEASFMSSPSLTTTTGSTSPRKWLKATPLYLMGRRRMFRRNKSSRKKNATPDSAAIRAAEALGKDLETMGYNLDCQSFITKDESHKSEKDGIDRYKRPPLPKQRMLSLDNSAAFDPVMQDRSITLTSSASSLPPSQVSMTRSVDSIVHGAISEDDIVLRHKLVEDDIRGSASVASEKSPASGKSAKSTKSSPSEEQAFVEASLSHNYHDGEGVGSKKKKKKVRDIHERTVIEVSLALSPDISLEDQASAELSAASLAEQVPGKGLRVSTDYVSNPPRLEAKVDSPKVKSPRYSPQHQENRKKSPISLRHETPKTSPKSPQHQSPRFGNASEQAVLDEKHRKSPRSPPPTRQMSPKSLEMASSMQAKNNAFVERERSNEGRVSESTSVTIRQTDKQANSATKLGDMAREGSDNTDSAANSAFILRMPSALTTSTTSSIDEQTATRDTTIEMSSKMEASTNEYTEDVARERSKIPSAFSSDLNNKTTNTARPMVETVEEGEESDYDGKQQQEHMKQEMERDRSGNTESISALSFLAGNGKQQQYPNQEMESARSENTESTMSFFPRIAPVLSSNANKKTVKMLEEIDENESVGSGRQQNKQHNAAAVPKQPSQKKEDMDKKSDVMLDGMSLVEEDGGISVCSALEETEVTVASEEQGDTTMSRNKSTISSKSSKSSRAMLLKRAVGKRRMRRYGDASTVPPKPPRAPNSSSAHRTIGGMSPKSLPAKPRSPFEETNMALQALRDSITLKNSLSKVDAAMKETDEDIKGVGTSAATIDDGATTQATMQFGEQSAVAVKKEVGTQTVLSPTEETITHADKKEEIAIQPATKTEAMVQVEIKKETSRPPDESKPPLPGTLDQSNDKGDNRNIEPEHKSFENAEASVGGILDDNEPTQKDAVKDARAAGPRLFGWRSRSLSPEKRSRRKQSTVTGWRKAKTKLTAKADTIDASAECDLILSDPTDDSGQPESTEVSDEAPTYTISPTAEFPSDTAILQQPEPSNLADQANSPAHQNEQMASGTETDSKAPVVTSSQPEGTIMTKSAESPAVSEGSTPGSTATVVTNNGKQNRKVRFSFFKKKDEVSGGVAKPKGGMTRGILKKKKKKEPSHVETIGSASSPVAVEVPKGTTNDVLSPSDSEPLSPVAPFKKPLDLHVDCFGEMSEDIEVKIQSPASFSSPKMLVQAHSSKLEAIEEVDSNFKENTAKAFDGKGIEMNLQGGVLSASTESHRKDGIISESASKEKTVPRSSPEGEPTSVVITKSPKTSKGPDTVAMSETVAEKPSHLRNRFGWSLLDNVLSCGGVEGTDMGLFTSNGKAMNKALANVNTSSEERSDESSSAPILLKTQDRKPETILPWGRLSNFECTPGQQEMLLDKANIAKDSPPDFKASGSDSSKEIYSEGIEVENSVRDVEDDQLAMAVGSPTVAAAAKSALDAIEATNCASPKSAYEALQNIQTGLVGKPPVVPKKNAGGGKRLSTPSVPSGLDPKKSQNAEKLLEFVSVRDPPSTRPNKIPSRLVIDLNYDEGSCLTSLPSVSGDMNKQKKQRKKNKRDGDNMSLKSIDTTDAEAWEEIAKASLIVENAIKTFMPGVDGGKSIVSSVGEEVEKAMETLKIHAERLGVKESDLLLAVRSNDDSTEGQSAANDIQSKPTGFNKDDACSSVDASVPSAQSLTLGEEILEAFKMYIKDSKVV